MKKIFILLKGLILFLLVNDINAGGLLSKQYSYMSIGNKWTGQNNDLRNIDTNMHTVNIQSNLPINENVDFGVIFHYQQIEGTYRSVDVKGREWDIGPILYYSFLPGKKIDPYIGLGFDYEMTKGELKDDIIWKDEKDYNTGIIAEAGSQYILPKDITSKTYLRYKKVSSENDVSVNEFLHIAFTDGFGAGILMSYFFDAKDTEISVGITLDI